MLWIKLRKLILIAHCNIEVGSFFNYFNVNHSRKTRNTVDVFYSLLSIRFITVVALKTIILSFV